MAYDSTAHWQELYLTHFELAGSGYTELGESYNRWLYKLRVKVFNKAVAESGIIIDKNSRVLDIGCGVGFWVKVFQKKGIGKLVGFDLTRISIERMQAEFPQYDFFQQDISAEVMQNEAFDFINCFDVLWYLDDADFERAFANLKILSKSGSYLFITDILRKEKSGQSEGWWPRSIPEYEFQCKKNGFEIIHIYPLFFFTNTPCDPDSVNKRFFRFLQFHWKILFYLLTKYNFMGNIFGFPLFMLDSAATSFLAHGPSSKLMVLRKG